MSHTGYIDDKKTLLSIGSTFPNQPISLFDVEIRIFTHRIFMVFIRWAIVSNNPIISPSLTVLEPLGQENDISGEALFQKQEQQPERSRLG